MPLIALIVGMATGCTGGGPPASPNSTERAAETSAVSAATKTIAVSITAGKVNPVLGRVEIAHGTTVRIVVTDDVADQVHVHGYDKEVELPAGKATVLEWVADIPGVFDVETHRTGTLLVQLLVR